MLRSLMMTQARKLANDTDSSNPFHSDTELESFIDDWGIDLAAYIQWPRAQQTITFAQGDGPNAGSITNAKNLNTDIIEILSVFLENTTSGVTSRLRPRREHEMQSYDPQWRYPTGQAIPNFYVILDGPAEQAANWPLEQVTVDKPCSEARTMRIHYIQAPAASTTTTNSPIFQPQYHKSGVYFMVSQMLEMRNPQAAELFMKKYLDERRRQKSLTGEMRDDAIEIWDHVQIWDQSIQYKG